MGEIGKWLAICGGILVIVGGLIWLGGKIGIPIGQLPGDIRISREKFTFYFPIITSIIISVVLTIVINLILYIMKR